MSLASQVADSISAKLAYWDKDLVCRYANDAYLNWLGRTREETIGKLRIDQLPSRVYEQNKPHIARVLAGDAQCFERSLVAADYNGMRYELVSFVPDMDNGVVKGFAVHVADITELKVSAQQAEQANSLLSAQNNNLLNFANIVSHNLRSYAANLGIMLDMYETEEDAEERNRLFNFIKEISADFKQSIENLTEIVKVQNLGRAPVQQVNLHSYALKATEVLQSRVVATQAIIHNNIGPEIIIEANPSYIESIVLNFIDNAIKYRHPDRKPVVELSTMVVGNETVLSIKDNGRGIDLARDRDKLYGMYNTFHDNEDATGIGLFMTKYQVDSMGGYIGVESDLDKGTWFRVYFRTPAIAG
jgi:PAS domain S-box-containing protein